MGDLIMSLGASSHLASRWKPCTERETYSLRCA